MATALPNPATEPERQIPLSEVPATIRELRAQWATSFTRAEQLERDLRECRAARDAARQTCDDLTAHAISQGDYIQRLTAQIERAEIRIASGKGLTDHYEAAAKNLRQRLRSDLAAYRDAIRAIYDDVYSDKLKDTVLGQIRALAECDDTDSDPLFDTCQVCGPYDCEDNPMPGCADCFGGKVVSR